jgi:hypothetical protein
VTSFCTGQSGQHAHSARGFDFYATPAIAVTALLDANPKHLDPASVRIWEPAAGDGGIVLPLRERGFAVIASDITARDFPLHFVSDFFLLTQAPAGTTTIITNPAYRSAQRFAEHAIDLAPDVFLLLRLCFLESVRRTDLLEHRGLYTLYVFSTQIAAHAPRWLEWPAHIELHLLRLVPLAPRFPRSTHCHPHLNPTREDTFRWLETERRTRHDY